MRLRRDAAFLLVVDVQDKLAPHVADHARVIARCGALLRAARLLEVPALVSEHCPEAIGATVDVLRTLVDDAAIVRKTHFAGTDEPGLLARLRALGRRQAVVCGMEAHVCVMQTVLGLAGEGIQPFVVADAVGSRRVEDRDAALERLRAAGAVVVTAEMAMFEWMFRADAPGFRELLAIVKGP